MIFIKNRMAVHYRQYKVIIFLSVLSIIVFSVFSTRTNSVEIQVDNGVTKIKTKPIHEKLNNIFEKIAVILIFLVFIVSTVMQERFSRKVNSDFQNFYVEVKNDSKELIPLTYKFDEFNEMANLLNAKIDYINKMMEAKNQYFNTTIHDIQNPLQVLHNSITLAKRNPHNMDYMHRIELATNALDYEINRYLQLEKINYFETPEYTKFDIVDAIRDYLNKSNISEFSVSIEQVPDEFEVYSDREMFNKIAVNLITNGRKHSVDGCIQIYIIENKVIFTNKVKDIKSDNLFSKERINSNNGFGLGTQIIKKYVDLLGWQIKSKVINNIIQIELLIPKEYCEGTNET